MSSAFECPSCALQVSGKRSDYESCPYCGYDFPHQKRGHAIVVVMFLILMVIFALYLM